jgi:putative ABC transport system permease protein
MNTLIINVVERTSEIGTMRAIGAEKSFIRRMFLLETLILNLSAALVAIVLTGILFITQGQRGIPLPETVSQFLIGGGPLPLNLSAGPFVLALLIVFVVSVFASVYPVRVATSITPLKAMSDH